VTRKPTIATVAERAGVAVSTVSRYLNGRYVSREAKARIADAIETLGYARSWTARNLSIGRKGCIGVVVDTSLDPWFNQVLAGIEEELSTRDTSLMLSSLELRGQYDPTTVFDWIRGRRVDGLIIAKSQRRERAMLREALIARVPLVMIAPDEMVTPAHVVRCDNYAGGVAVAHHLAELGHRRIAFLGGPEHSLDSQHRLRGLNDGLTLHGVRQTTKATFFCGSYEADAGAAFAQEFLGRPTDITALVAANDALALGFMRVAHQRRLRLPRDLSIVGFDDVPLGGLTWPALTTVAQPMREMGRAACCRLFEAISSPGLLETTEYPVTLVVRGSTARPPAARPR
jgi:LacI family transcriptional regulator